MSQPISTTYHCTTGSLGGFAVLSEQIPTSFSSSAFGWNMGQNTPPNFCEMSRSFEVIRTDVSWVASPSSSVPNPVRGNCWVFGPLDGELLSGNWNITMSVKPVNNANNQRGNFVYRFWKGESSLGTNAGLITPTFYSSSIHPAATGPTGIDVIQNLSSSISLPYINLRNEYIFIQTYWSIFSAAGNNNSDENFVFGNNVSRVIPPPFIRRKHSIVRWNNGDNG